MANSEKTAAQIEWEKVLQYDQEMMEKIKEEGRYDIVTPMTPYGVRFVYRNCLLGFVSYDGRLILEPSLKYYKENKENNSITAFDDKGRWKDILFIHL